MADDKTILEVLKGIRDVSSARTLTNGEQLDILSVAWATTAASLRSAALAFPHGFQTERTRQVAVLQKMAALISEDTPDLELERLVLEDDVVGLQRHLENKLGQAS